MHSVHPCVFFLQIPRMVKVVEQSSPYFKVISPKDSGHKVAPGVPSIFRILFTPEENKVTTLARNCLNACHWQCTILDIHGGGGGGGGGGLMVVVVFLMVLVLTVLSLSLVVVRGVIGMGERRGWCTLGMRKELSNSAEGLYEL